MYNEIRIQIHCLPMHLQIHLDAKEYPSGHGCLPGGFQEICRTEGHGLVGMG